jgi:transcriptional regulator with XRE-family HTH domain
MPEPDEFGERLRRRRMALGWSQVEFARRIGVGPAAISRYEGGTYKSMAFTRLRQIAETLATSTDYLLGLTPDAGPLPD